MVSPSRTPVSPSQLRPLNVPQPVRVETGEGETPTAVHGSCRLGVMVIRDRWRIDDEWWRQPISRLYFQLVLGDGRCDTLYRDLLTGQWYRQSY